MRQVTVVEYFRIGLHQKVEALKKALDFRIGIKIYSVFKPPKFWLINLLPALHISDRPVSGFNIIFGFLFWQLQIDFGYPTQEERDMEKMLKESK